MFSNFSREIFPRFGDRRACMPSCYFLFFSFFFNISYSSNAVFFLLFKYHFLNKLIRLVEIATISFQPLLCFRSKLCRTSILFQAVFQYLLFFLPWSSFSCRSFNILMPYLSLQCIIQNFLGLEILIIAINKTYLK